VAREGIEERGYGEEGGKEARRRVDGVGRWWE